MFAYVDSSCLVAIALGEPGSARLAQRLKSYERRLSSNLLEAELRAALVREGVEKVEVDNLLDWISWISPERPLGEELRRASAEGYLRGADLWHVACALYFSGGAPNELVFETLDRKQQQLASRLGFRLPAEADGAKRRPETLRRSSASGGATHLGGAGAGRPSCRLGT